MGFLNLVYKGLQSQRSTFASLGYWTSRFRVQSGSRDQSTLEFGFLRHFVFQGIGPRTRDSVTCFVYRFCSDASRYTSPSQPHSRNF